MQFADAARLWEQKKIALFQFQIAFDGKFICNGD